MTANRYILEDSIPIKTPNLKVESLDISHTAYIYENSYIKKYISKRYVRERLSKDISAGIFINNKLIAWGFTHDDGALGFLHIIEEYRKKGYATEILNYLINERRSKGKAVFANILVDNFKSTGLINQLDFKKDRQTCWLKLK